MSHYPDGTTQRMLDDAANGEPQDDEHCSRCGAKEQEFCTLECDCWFCVNARDTLGEKVDELYLDWKENQ